MIESVSVLTSALLVFAAATLLGTWALDCDVGAGKLMTIFLMLVGALFMGIMGVFFGGMGL